MIEAYEIGIRLALDDGISAGVQAIKRELLELDRVVEASSVKLASLRDAAGLVSAPSVVEPRSSAEVQAAEPEEATQTPERRVGRSPEAAADETPNLRGASPAVRLPLEGAELDDTPARASAPSPSRERRDAPAEPAADRAPYWTGSASPADVPAPKPHASAPREASASTDAAPFAPAAVVPSAAAQDAIVDGQAAAPIVGAPPSGRSSPPAAELSSAGGASPRTDAASRPSAPTWSPPASSVRPTRAPPSAAATFSRSAAPAAASATQTASRRSGGAPSARTPSAARETVAPEQAAPDRQQEPAKAGEDADQRTIEVFIYLEGAPLGRWMADQLDRAASRPSASVTGFDPRVGPAWPGAPIG